MEKQKYILTGATGNLGSGICRAILARGCEVRTLVLPNDPAIKYVPDEVQIVYGDLLDMAALEQLYGQWNGQDVYFIHCASIVTLNPEFNRKVYDVNVTGTENIINLCQKHGCKKMVYISSTSVIPEPPNNQPIREVTSFDDSMVMGFYSKTKAIATQKVLDAVHKDRLPACIVHPTGICGPGDIAFGDVTTLICDIASEKSPVLAEGSFNICDVRDLAEGVLNACDMGTIGECYILGNELITVRELSRIVSRTAGVKPVKIFLPTWFIKKIAPFMETMAKKKGERPLLTPFSVYNLTRNNHFDSSKAKRGLNYCTRPFAETIRDEVVWLKEIGRI